MQHDDLNKNLQKYDIYDQKYSRAPSIVWQYNKHYIDVLKKHSQLACDHMINLWNHF